MNLTEMADEVLLRSGPASVHVILGGIREMFAVRIKMRALLAELDRPSGHFIRVGHREYAVHATKRADWLVKRFGLW